LELNIPSRKTKHARGKPGPQSDSFSSKGNHFGAAIAKVRRVSDKGVIGPSDGPTPCGSYC